MRSAIRDQKKYTKNLRQHEATKMHNMFVHVAFRPHPEQFPTPLLTSSCQGPIALLRCDSMVGTGENHCSFKVPQEKYMQTL